MDADRLEQALGHQFVRRDLLLQALTHRSFGSPHNERLEFLGDSVLNCVVASLLFERFAGLREGELSRLRAALVRQETLHQVASGIDLGDCLRLGEGELRSGGSRRPSILADALEAMFGAAYLDGGFAAAQAMIARLYGPMLDEIDPGNPVKDAKTALQELLQGRRLPLPRYNLVATRGDAHDQTFEVECVVDGFGLRCRGVGSSRRAAEQDAARTAIAEIKAK